jgi:phosphoribosylanthranilate isomerase
MSLPFKIKICGVTSADNAQAVAEAGADAIGLNFYSRSRRCITPEQARDIAAAIPKHIAKIGVFVNPNSTATNLHRSLLAFKRRTMSPSSKRFR